MGPRARSASERRAAAADRRARRAEVSNPQVVMEAAAAFLAVRPRSVDETRRRLRHLGYPPALCDEVIGRLEDVGYLDDATFARAWVESRDRARPRGATVLRRELRAKGVAEETIRLVLAERQAGVPDRSAGAEGHASGAAGASAAGGDVAAADRLLERRGAALSREPDPRRRRQKAYALLARNGFDPDVCAAAVGRAFAAPSDGGGDV